MQPESLTYDSAENTITYSFGIKQSDDWKFVSLYKINDEKKKIKKKLFETNVGILVVVGHL